MIDQKDFLHGAALVAVADSSQFTALNKDKGYDHYVVNHDRHVFIKHTDQPGADFRFTYQSEELRRIREAARNGKAFVVLVCGQEAIAALPFQELEQVIDLDTTSSQWLKVTGELRKSLRICGSHGKLRRALARNAFPKPVLG